MFQVEWIPPAALLALAKKRGMPDGYDARDPADQLDVNHPEYRPELDLTEDERIVG